MIFVRPMRDSDCEKAAEILVSAFAQVYRQRGHMPPFPNIESAIWLCRAYLELDPDGCLVAEVGGGASLVGVGFVHIRGAVASIGPLAARPGSQRGVGRALMAHLTAMTRHCASRRLFHDSFNPDSFGLYTQLGYQVRDVAPYLMTSDIVPTPVPVPGIRAFRSEDLPSIEEFDRQMTGADRARDLALLLSTGTLLVCERDGDALSENPSTSSSPIEGFVFLRSLPARAIIGPALATSELVLADLLDAACQALPGRAAVMRASASAPLVLKRAFERGFRVDHLGNLMVEGSTSLPPAQLYALFPESL